MSVMLSTLFQDIPARLIAGDMNERVDCVVYDSRKAGENSLFVAIKGFNSDGHSYIPDVLSKGASCIVAETGNETFSEDELRKIASEHNASVLMLDDTKKGIALISAAYYGHPEDRLDLVGVTGTKGKTTTTFMMHEILRRDDHKTGLIGTVKNIIGDEEMHSVHTTPQAHELYELFDKLARKGFDSCVMEVSSLGLKFDRVYGLRFDVACFTNLYEDHISEEEHPDMEDYLVSKLKIFDSCRTAVINRDCEAAGRAIAYASERCPVYTYGLTDEADCYAYDIKKVRKGHVTGSSFKVRSPWYNTEFFVALPGIFNIYNALCAICTAGILKADEKNVREGLEKVFVPGRVQPVENDLGISILVDYAHNAASLKSVLETLREYTEGRIITVFGCGGNRSRTRRFEMGEVSGDLSDLTIITSDNPRNEEPAAIINDIVTGISKTDGKFETIEDRYEAIEHAVFIASPGDTVLIAGKGHEDYQIFADRTIRFVDHEAALKAVHARESCR